MTFLTQVYKESEFNQKDLNDKFPDWPESKNIVPRSRELIANHASCAENVAHQKHVQREKLDREREVKVLFNEIQGVVQAVRETEIKFFQD